MKKIILYLLLLTSLSVAAQNENCGNKQIELVSEHSVKSRYFFFRKTSFEKHQRVDKIIDENGKVLVECTMKSKQDHDQFFIKKFRRIVITNNQIHEVEFKFNDEFGSLKIYNKCGELIETKKPKTKVLYETYNFNATIL
ncbi:hypothetical protein [Flavobacterium pectinovorum]|uniref:hypothetical protein n=1 Tax=Flavobacterium pectinovorum TaxID=29533 RepID=UPI001FACAF37|nr:hypothetical protein [Flavobacterium pectinovorum]MCI9843511.1 hypothetical protein [Flavobacterium pectinovorum]